MRPPVQREKLLSLMKALGQRDLKDAGAMVREGLVRPDLLIGLFEQIEPQLIRYPALDPVSFRAAVIAFCGNDPNLTHPISP